jgi:hypothetical protein
MPSYKVVGKLCILSGVVSFDGTTQLLSTLGSDCKPSSNLVFAVNHHINTLRIDVSSALSASSIHLLIFLSLPFLYQVKKNGQILWVDGAKNFPWFSLDGISFIVASEDDD